MKTDLNANALIALVAGMDVIPEVASWGGLRDLAERHGVVPLVIANLPPGVPEADSLREVGRSIAARNLAATAQLIAIASLLREAAIPFVPVKGPVLALRAYGNVALRQFSDLDLLVERDHAARALQVMLEDGNRPEISLGTGRLADIIRVRHEVMFDTPDLPVEIQWAIAPRHHGLDVDTDAMVRRAQAILVGGQTLSVLTPEDEIVYLAAHATKHRWERYAWTVDLDRAVTSRGSIGWTSVGSAARASGTFRGLQVGLHLCWMLLGSSWVPTALGAIGKDVGAWSVARRLAESMFVEGEAAEVERETSVDGLDLALRDDLFDRCAVVWRTLVTPTERELERTTNGALRSAARVTHILGRAIRRSSRP